MHLITVTILGGPAQVLSWEEVGKWLAVPGTFACSDSE